MSLELGNRMKLYENVSQNVLIKRMPVIIRIDGKAFHSFLKPVKDPFDNGVIHLMSKTMEYLCENIQNAVLGYTQSDEISILLKDWENIKTDQWFSGKQNKIESISASMATGIFNAELNKPELLSTFQSLSFLANNGKFAMFDARAFNIPREDVTNYFLWRQQDAMRNSVSALARTVFSHKELHKVNVEDMKYKMLKEKGISWDELSVYKQRGHCWKRGVGLVSDIPVFVKEGRNFIEELLQ